MSTVSSSSRLLATSIAQDPHFVERAVCELTQCIDGQLFRWLEGLNVLEQPFPWFFPVYREPWGGAIVNQRLKPPVQALFSARRPMPGGLP